MTLSILRLQGCWSLKRSQAHKNGLIGFSLWPLLTIVKKLRATLHYKILGSTAHPPFIKRSKKNDTIISKLSLELDLGIRDRGYSRFYRPDFCQPNRSGYPPYSLGFLTLFLDPQVLDSQVLDSQVLDPQAVVRDRWFHQSGVAWGFVMVMALQIGNGMLDPAFSLWPWILPFTPSLGY